MSWTAIGAIGELVGGVLVVVTLVYLAVQIRQNTRATRASATAYVAAEMERSVLALAESAGLAEAFVKAAQRAELSAVERTRLLAWWGAHVRVSESHVLQSQLGATSEDVRPPVARLLRQLAEVPVLRESLQQMMDQEVQTAAFRAWVREKVLS